MPAGGHLNIDMLAYQYRDPHVKDKTVLWRLIFKMGIPIPGDRALVTQPH